MGSVGHSSRPYPSSTALLDSDLSRIETDETSSGSSLYRQMSRDTRAGGRAMPHGIQPIFGRVDHRVLDVVCSAVKWLQADYMNEEGLWRKGGNKDQVSRVLCGSAVTRKGMQASRLQELTDQRGTMPLQDAQCHTVCLMLIRYFLLWSIAGC